MTDGGSLDHIVSMCHDLLFQRERHTITGEEAEKRAFVCGQPCTDMTFDDSDDGWKNSQMTGKDCPFLSMGRGMGDGPPHIMEQSSCFYQGMIDKRIEVLCRSFLDVFAVFADCPAAPCSDEQILSGITHNKGIYGSSQSFYSVH